MTEVAFTFLLHHNDGNHNHTDHDKSSNNTANDDAQAVA